MQAFSYIFLIEVVLTISCLYQSLYNQQQAVWNQWQNGGGDANSVPYYAPNYASSSGSYGPDGIHQTASIYPPNPVRKMDKKLTTES